MSDHRSTIYLEDAEVLAHESHPGDQYVLRMRAPECAARARPGQFVHITCDPALPMRRPMSLMRADAETGSVEVLYKIVGEGTRLLAQRVVGERLSVLGPIGRAFEPDPGRPRALLIGGGVGIPPMVFLADALRRERDRWRPLALMGSEAPFPFRPRPSQIMVPGVGEGVIAAMPLLEEWGVPSRLASRQGFAGCHDGLITEPARGWLDALGEEGRTEIEVFACGPHAMLEAVAELAREYDLPCQVALEEFMACGVGGCAGCTVEVRTEAGPAMRRVCVDGPVFDSREVFF